MKKINSMLTFGLAIFLLSSCTKQMNDADQEELMYKAKVEKLINIAAHPTTFQDLEMSKLPRLDFASYKEAYNAFKFLDSGQQLITVTSPKFSTTVKPLDQFYYNYSFRADPQSTRTVSGTWGFESIVLLYHIEYTLSYNPPTVTQNLPSNPIVYYSGFGTGSSQRIAVTPISQSSNKGLISGAVQINGTLKGVPYSLFITLSGSYYFTVPIQEYVYQTIVVTMLTAKAS